MDAPLPLSRGSRHSPAARPFGGRRYKRGRGLKLYLHGFVDHGGTEGHDKRRNHWGRRLRSRWGRRCWGGCISHVEQALQARLPNEASFRPAWGTKRRAVWCWRQDRRLCSPAMHKERQSSCLERRYALPALASRFALESCKIVLIFEKYMSILKMTICHFKAVLKHCEHLNFKSLLTFSSAERPPLPVSRPELLGIRSRTANGQGVPSRPAQFRSAARETNRREDGERAVDAGSWVVHPRGTLRPCDHHLCRPHASKGTILGVLPLPGCASVRVHNLIGAVRTTCGTLRLLLQTQSISAQLPPPAFPGEGCVARFSFPDLHRGFKTRRRRTCG